MCCHRSVLPWLSQGSSGGQTPTENFSLCTISEPYCCQYFRSTSSLQSSCCICCATSVPIGLGAVLQNGPRGRREREFYERVRTELRTEKAARLRAAAQTSVSEDISDEDDQASVSGRSDDDADTQANLPFSVRNAAMLAAVPRFCEFSRLSRFSSAWLTPCWHPPLDC